MTTSKAVPLYSEVAADERDVHDTNPTLEAGEWLLGGRKETCPGERTLYSIVQAAWARWRWLVETGLLLVILGLLVERQWASRHCQAFEGAGDITGFAPRVAQQIKTFVPDFSYAPQNASEFFTDAVQQKWVDLVPKGLGYIKMDNPEQYEDLPTPIEGFNDTTVFSTSVTHQLHCLHAMIEVFAGYSTDPSSVPEDRVWHLGHCFEYLRQSIMCCGDTALEGQETTFPEGVMGSDGWDAKHVCKDYSQIHQYLEENRANDEIWI